MSNDNNTSHEDTDNQDKVNALALAFVFVANKLAEFIKKQKAGRDDE